MNRESQSISVVVCTYNLRPSLGKLIQALNQQTYKNFELILVDNGPFFDNKNHIDGLIVNCQFKVKYVSLEKNLGPGIGRNLGVNHASFEIIAFTDDDCIPAANWLEIISREISQNKKMILTGKVYSHFTPRYPYIHAFEPGDRFFITANAAFTKTWFKTLGGFDEFLNTWSEDFEIAQRSKTLGVDFEYIEDLLVYHPPVIKNFAMKDHVMNYQFLKKYFYIIRYKKYPFKFHLLRDTAFKALLKLFFISIFLVIPFIPMVIKGVAPFICFGLIYFRKVMQVNQLIQSHNWGNRISIINAIYYSLTFWIIDIINLFFLSSFSLQAMINPRLYHPNKK